MLNTTSLKSPGFCAPSWKSQNPPWSLSPFSLTANPDDSISDSLWNLFPSFEPSCIALWMLMISSGLWLQPPIFTFSLKLLSPSVHLPCCHQHNVSETSRSSHCVLPEASAVSWCSKGLACPSVICLTWCPLLCLSPTFTLSFWLHSKLTFSDHVGPFPSCLRAYSSLYLKCVSLYLCSSSKTSPYHPLNEISLAFLHFIPFCIVRVWLVLSP